MHASILDFTRKHLTHPTVHGATVLEVGSYNRNGTVRHYIELLQPAKYVGVDIQDGPGVDLICACENLTDYFGPENDIVIATELLEHVYDWQTCITQLVEVTKPGGLLLITTRSPNYHYHPNPGDHWRYTLGDMCYIAGALPIRIVAIDKDPLAPGVFMLAVKCAPLTDIEVAAVDPNSWQPSPSCTCPVCKC